MKPSWIISKIILLFGSYFRYVIKIPLLGRTVGLTNKAFGRLLPKLSFLGFRKEASYENAVWNWEIFLKLIDAQYEVEETSMQSRSYTIKKCPAGHCRLEHIDACKATMELDNSLVENSGARIIIDKRFPIDGICIERIILK
ncbi:MAG: hypothetical protein HQK77_15395 [Desulfobacterales bacterium]|nr:hypothetical protein [Desulfobacterales bacterium]